ncbi:MAG TPA: AraC family transcriptional regulator [Planctomycetota bacterium]|nr:AraC family transcriptional regulator [Planctomycetota bacterium]
MQTVGTSPIEGVIFCGELGPQQTGFSFQATSLPGHLIHIMLRGEVRQDCNGREYHIRPGDVIWYHEDELVRGTVLKGPWIWYSVGFIARTMPPPAFELRQLRPPLRDATRPFEAMLAAWKEESLPAPLRTFRVHAALLELLAVLHPLAFPREAVNAARNVDPRARLWWELETELRKRLDQPLDLRAMEELCGRSQATIARSCRFAVGLAPLKRMKQVRMSLARGLVQRSGLTMTEIAARIGYSRVHEFSRDYRKHHGIPPTEHRQNPEFRSRNSE